MYVRGLKVGVVVLAGGLAFLGIVRAQQQPAASQTSATADVPPVPQGVEVLARGPVHEAFATPTTDPVPTQAVDKQPPRPLEEMPPEQKPEGDVVWIGGYYAWDEDRKDFLWVSGIWRTVPPGKSWVAGYWRETDDHHWQWVPGFWSGAAKQTEEQQEQVTYLPAPPAAPQVARAGEAPTADSFYVPGTWVWTGDKYVWQAGYWARVQPGYVWVPGHYRWTPSGYIYIPGYWDLAVAQRGVLFAPVYVDAAYVGPAFVYTPAYVVSGTIVLDSLFVRPCYCHYYFGDYYGPVYRERGFESCIVYSRGHYDSIIVYSSWEHRDEPRWASVQLDICLARHAGQAPVPPRTLVQQNVIVQRNVTNVTNITNVTNNTTINNTTNVTRNNTQVLVPASQMTSVTGTRTVSLTAASRVQAQQQAKSVQQVAVQRSKTEVTAPGGAPSRPRVASFNVPKPQPVQSSSTSKAVNHGPTSPTVGSQAGHPSSAPYQPQPHGANAPTNPRGPYNPNQAHPGQPMPPNGRGPNGTTQPGHPNTNQRPPNRPAPNSNGHPPPAHSQPPPKNTQGN
jgi:hypothetical protein